MSDKDIRTEENKATPEPEPKAEVLVPAPPDSEASAEVKDTAPPSFWKQHKKRIVIISSSVLAAAMLVWLYLYLQPTTWHYYTDETSFKQLAKDVEPRFVAWENAAPVDGVMAISADLHDAAVAPDGVHMVYTTGGSEGNSDLFVSRMEDSKWVEGSPLRALNSDFNEKAPAFSSDGQFLYFATDRPGGPGGFDIWVSRFDGAHFAWPVPLSKMVNSAFDDIDPAVSPAHDKLYFSSKRPARELDAEESKLPSIELRERFADLDYDVYAADRIPAGVTNREVERAMSMLYYLRESALSDTNTMAILGGTPETEQAVDKALAWLASNQETNGVWDIKKHGGQSGHDVASTSFALLAFLGRGETHKKECKYQDNVRRGLEWLIAHQDAFGHLEGNGYDHGIGTLALAEAYGVTKDQDWLYGPAQSAVDWLVDSQHLEGGGWRYNAGQAGDLSVSGWAIMALKSAEYSGITVPRTTLAGIRIFLDSVSGGKKGGLYGYTGPGGGGDAMIATGYFCSQLMGLSPNTWRSFETSTHLNTKGVASADLYYAYYGTLSAYQGQGPTWGAWKDKLHDIFLKQQQADGAWPAQGGDSHGKSMGEVITTALVTLSLQAHYRYTPLYGLGYEPDPGAKDLSKKNLDELPEVPLYRRAKQKAEFSSAQDDVQVALTSHGDFLYLVSDREGGMGGMDIYRHRISGLEPGEAQHLGPEINSEADDTSPALRMAGFNIVFSSNRGEGESGKYRLHGAMTRQVYRHHSFSGFPPLSYIWEHFQKRLLFLVVGILLLIWFVRIAMRPKKAGKPPTETVETVPDASKGDASHV